MLSTSLAVALSGMLAAAAPASQPAWQPDYGTAVARAAELHKPLAVFIARGEGGFAKVAAGGVLPADAARLLRQQFVCVYIDTDKEDGKQLAGSFKVTEGLVISGRSGEKQALRHEGTVPPADLTRYLEKYSDPAGVVEATEVQGVVAVAPPVVAAPQPAPVFYGGPLTAVRPAFSAGACRT